MFTLLMKRETEYRTNAYILPTKKDADTSKRIFKLRFSFRNMKYDINKKYYLVAFEEKTSLEVLRHEMMIDIAFADDFGF